MKKNYYLTLDTETATLPFVNEICKTASQKKKIAIAKPLIYDIGWVITDRQGNICKQASYLVQETFFVPSVFNTAYYKDKRPLYIEKLNQGKIITKNWNDIMLELDSDLQSVTISNAYNACFDFKKALPFTNKYIYHLYNNDFNEWMQKQKQNCINILNGVKNKNKTYLNSTYTLNEKEYPICDLWGIACKHLLNNNKYKNYCLNNNKITASGLYFSTSAETAFQYLTKDIEFIEEHTAFEDALIESKILTKILKKCGITAEIEPFPFRILGSTIEYIEKSKKPKQAEVIATAIENWLSNADTDSNYAITMIKNLEKISKYF